MQDQHRRLSICTPPGCYLLYLLYPIDLLFFLLFKWLDLAPKTILDWIFLLEMLILLLLGIYLAITDAV